MSRIEATFSALKAQGRKALIPYVTAGFPFADIPPRSCTAWWMPGPT
jgi:tryptophan synthase alpha chain